MNPHHPFAGEVESLRIITIADGKPTLGPTLFAGTAEFQQVVDNIKIGNGIQGCTYHLKQPSKPLQWSDNGRDWVTVEPKRPLITRILMALFHDPAPPEGHSVKDALE